MLIRIECGLDSRSRAGFCENYTAGVLTSFFPFNKAAKTRYRLDSRIYGIYIAPEDGPVGAETCSGCVIVIIKTIRKVQLRLTETPPKKKNLEV
jgi:hypothetical protein